MLYLAFLHYDGDHYIMDDEECDKNTERRNTGRFLRRFHRGASRSVLAQCILLVIKIAISKYISKCVK